MLDERVTVFQSVPELHPSWVDSCMARVRAWAAQNHAQYYLIDDQSFLAQSPSWVRDKCGARISPVTDFARLQVALDLLESVEVAVWVDADVLILDIAALRLPRPADAAFVREAWIMESPDGRLMVKEHIANYICAFREGSRFLRRYYMLALEAAARAPAPLRLGVAGTTLLSTMILPTQVEILSHVGNVSPTLTYALLTPGRRAVISMYDRCLGEELHAVNLCMSLGQEATARLAEGLLELRQGGRITALHDLLGGA